MCILEVAWNERLKPFLTCSVPQLQTNHFSSHINILCDEIDSYCGLSYVIIKTLYSLLGQIHSWCISLWLNFFPHSDRQPTPLWIFGWNFDYLKSLSGQSFSTIQIQNIINEYSKGCWWEKAHKRFIIPGRSQRSRKSTIFSIQYILYFPFIKIYRQEEVKHLNNNAAIREPRNKQ